MTFDKEQDAIKEADRLANETRIAQRVLTNKSRTKFRVTREDNAFGQLWYSVMVIPPGPEERTDGKDWKEYAR